MQAELVQRFFELRAALAWAPDWAAGVILLVIAAAIALGIHYLLRLLIRRLVPTRYQFARSLLERSKAPTRLAIVLFAIGAALPAVPFDPEITLAIAHAVLVGFILLLGWVAVIAIQIAANRYLRRFRLDAEDNLLARKHVTQVRILQRAMVTVAMVVTAAGVLMTFDAVRQYGVSLFASAGVAGLIIGLAARPVLANLIAGIQIAVTQPIRIDDVVIVEGEYGTIEEITSTYVVVKIWDLRRMIVPLSYFIEKPFENWTREGAALLGSVLLYLDHTAPIAAMREKLKEIVANSRHWDGKIATMQVTDTKENVIEVRALVSARTSGTAWDLRCEVREKLIEFLRTEHPEALPRRRSEVVGGEVKVARETTGGVEQPPERG